jgi:cell division protein FtsW
MVLPFLPAVGSRVNDASSWVVIGPVNFQPSEFLKLALLLACANHLAKHRDEMHDPMSTLVPVLGLAIAACGLCLLQGDLGSAIILASIVFTMAFIAGASLLPLTIAGAFGVMASLAFVVSSPRREARFTAFMDIAAHKDHLSYQTWQAMIAIAQGGVTGSGVGRGENKLGEFLPLAHSDFIFAVVAEELGMIGVVAVLGGFMVLAYAGVQVAIVTQDRFHALVAGGVVCWFVVQAIINVGGVTGLMPVTGLTLPFFSAGGSSLFVTLAATGLLLNVARNVR